MADDAFDDVLAANAACAAGEIRTLAGRPARKLAVLTCIDARVDPLAMLGLDLGDAMVIRNAGARATDDALRSLAVSTHLLGVERVLVVAHTECRMATSESALQEALVAAGGDAAAAIDLHATPDQEQALREDVETIRSSPLLPPLEVGGVVYELATGRVTRVC